MGWDTQGSSLEEVDLGKSGLKRNIQADEKLEGATVG